MERYRIVRETKYSGCIPITTYFVQVRKESRLSYGWTNIKGFDTYKKAKELLDIRHRSIIHRAFPVDIFAVQHITPLLA